MEKAKPTSSADEIDREVEKAFKACKGDSEDGMSPVEGVSFDPLLSSISNESSSRLFPIMIPYMSSLGAVMSGGEGILGELQDEIAVVSFLQRASCSPRVWHTLSCSSPEAPEILSRLFKMGTRAERIMMDHSSSGSSCYEQICAMAGPTTNSLSQSYYKLMASIIQRLSHPILASLRSPYSFTIARDVQGPTRMQYARGACQLAHVHYEGDPAGSGPGEDLLDFILDAFPSDMNPKLFEDEGATGSS
ncbi:hypothetical protein EDB19DRAFT_1692493 [Suillus lakei]|nr:hypothetical protein EDB19DRAFT_1692493 [Suillus lakei]